MAVPRGSAPRRPSASRPAAGRTPGGSATARTARPRTATAGTAVVPARKPGAPAAPARRGKAARRSPRTSARPADFLLREAAFGALVAWLAFAVLGFVAFVLFAAATGQLSGALPRAWSYIWTEELAAVGVAVPAVLVGTVVAIVVGKLFSRWRMWTLHLAGILLDGAVVGSLAYTAILAVTESLDPTQALTIPLVATVPAALAAAIGWLWAVARANRRDRATRPRPRR